MSDASRRAVVVGAGLGGLLAAAFLVREYDVDVYERLPNIGGRFYNLPYHGYQLSTGALHMIPHGPSGPLAFLLSAAGADVEIVKSVPDAMVRLDGRDVAFRDMNSHFPLRKKLKLLAMPWRVRHPRGSVADMFGRDPYLVGISDSYYGWCCSLTAAEVPAVESLVIMENLRRFGTPGIPMGGCSAVCDALRDVVEAKGGRVHTSRTVEEIRTRNGAVKDVVVNGECIAAELVFSDIGHRLTSRLLDHPPAGYGDADSHYRPSAGIKINLGSRDGLFDHGGVLFTPHTRRVTGLIQPTNTDPGLAPDGYNLAISHQTVRGTDLHHEIELGLRDLKEMFPRSDYEVLAVQCYRGDWPVNRVATGYDPGQATPVRGLWVVGDGAMGRGEIEVEGVALGVAQALEGAGLEHGVEL